jgi:hypothetical protein
MRTLSRGLTLLAVTLLVAACENPTEPMADGADDLLASAMAPGGQPASVTGSGMLTFAYGPRTFRINAIQTDGMAAKGTMTLATARNKPRDSWKGDVTCMVVTGNTAVVAGTTDRAPERFDGGIFGEGGTWAMVAVDNGEGSGDDPDMMSLVRFYNEAVPEDICDGSRTPPSPVWVPEGGNLQVRAGSGG